MTSTSTNKMLALAATGIGALLAARAAVRSSRSIDFEGKSVVIVGGSRGLGLILARKLAAEGARLTLIARDEDELDRARIDLEDRGASVFTVTCDIRDRAAVDAAIAQIATKRGGIDVLINDAGIIQVGPVDNMTVEDFEAAMATHFWGPLHTTLAALPYLRQSGSGRIVNISSIGGKVAVPHLLPYSASKFALTGLSEGLRAELMRDGIRVTTVCPGLMRTGSSYNAWFKGHHRNEFTWFHLAASMPGLSINADRAARQIIEACRCGDAELIITPQARAAVLLNAACPGTLAAVMAMTNRLLPGPINDDDAREARSGWQSVSGIAPSIVTRLGDRASETNNEVPTGMQA
jgi:NAD(P)-dependent dehydrogenase (short-subunit alcohol dehydrogenase family)